MEYTWESVMLGLDVKNEATAKQKRHLEIQEKRDKEGTMSSLWSLGLSVLGFALWGPAGGFIGKQLGKYGADEGLFGGDYSDWESMAIDEGKFDREKTRQYNKELAKLAEEGDWANAISTVVDLGAAYIQSGGLTAEPGEWDPTTFGSGESEWSVFGKEGSPFTGTTWSSDGAGGMLHPVTGEAIGSAPMPAGTPGISSLWDKDVSFTQNVLRAGTNLGTAYTQSNTPEVLYEKWQQIQEEKEAKRKSKKG